jgi:AcrR family transcriptional regulator
VPTRQRLTREAVLRAAVALVDERGLPALSMRSLGRRLGVEAMSLYNHVPSKEALLDGLVEVVLSGVGSEAQDWREALREIARGYREASQKHPEIVKLFAARRFATPPWVRTTEDTLAAFRRGGFDDVSAVHGYRIVSSYLTGYVFGELRLLGAPSLPEYLEQIGAADFPVLHELVSELVHVDRADEYELGLELILDALERRRVGEQEASYLDSGPP